WAILCAADCHEQAGDWEKAEELIRRLSERYESSETEWYMWCRRTGKGDPAAARALALKRYSRADNLLTDYERVNVAAFYFLEKKYRESFDRFLALFETERLLEYGM